MLRRIIHLGCLGLALSCTQSQFDSHDFPTVDPGPGAWDPNDPTCASDGDCLGGETCLGNVCQVRRCTGGPYTSTAPLSDKYYFLLDREILVADGTSVDDAYWVDGYSPQTSSLTYYRSWDPVTSPITDLTGGNLDGARPEDMAVATSGSPELTLALSSGPLTLPLGFVPVAVAAGDVDHDYLDEVVALGAGGEVAICHADERRCDGYLLTGVTGIDVAVADVDGDRFAEPILLIDNGGQLALYVWNTDAAVTGQSSAVSAPVARSLYRITAGDLDGDGIAEVVGLEDGGWFGWASDKVALYRVDSTITEVGTGDVDSDTIDIASSDTNMDQLAELVVLRSDHVIDVYRGTGSTTLALAYTAPISVTVTPARLATADVDGDSPLAQLLSGPELIAGQIVPTMLLTLPPYDREHSLGLSSVYVGSSQSTSTSYTDSVSLRLGAHLGFDANFAGAFSVRVSDEVSRDVTTSTTLSQSLSIGDRFSLEPHPEIYGPEYAAVVLSGGCYHGYTYELDDPTGALGPNGGRFIIVQPVGGQTTLWSLKRYNAMVAAVGGMPLISDATRVGDPDSYPNAPVLPDGQPVPQADRVFPQPPTFLVSDVGNAGWSLGVGTNQTTATATSIGLSTNACISVAGFSFGGSAGGSWGNTYSVSVGSDAAFSGSVPPIPDRPETPEDEYALYRFSFSPLVYRRHYQDTTGNDAAFYVMSFIVGR